MRGKRLPRHTLRLGGLDNDFRKADTSTGAGYIRDNMKRRSISVHFSRSFAGHVKSQFMAHLTVFEHCASFGLGAHIAWSSVGQGKWCKSRKLP